MDQTTFTYGDKTFTVSFGMLFQRNFWEAILKELNLSGADLLALIIFEGTKAFAKLNGQQSPFKAIADVYSLLEAHSLKDETTIQEQAILGAFHETQAYKSIFPESEPTEEKKT